MPPQVPPPPESYRYVMQRYDIEPNLDQTAIAYAEHCPVHAIQFDARKLQWEDADPEETPPIATLFVQREESRDQFRQLGRRANKGWLDVTEGWNAWHKAVEGGDGPLVNDEPEARGDAPPAGDREEEREADREDGPEGEGREGEGDETPRWPEIPESVSIHEPVGKILAAARRIGWAGKAKLLEAAGVELEENQWRKAKDQLLDLKLIETRGAGFKLEYGPVRAE